MRKSQHRVRLSRRDLLKGGLATAGGTLLARAAKAVGLPIVDPPLHARPQADPKRIYIAPDDHTDYFWSGNEATYKNAFLEMIDFFLDLADSTAGNRVEHQSRWNCDGSFWVWTYERNKSPQDFERLIARIRDGHISMPLTALASCAG